MHAREIPRDIPRENCHVIWGPMWESGVNPSISYCNPLRYAIREIGDWYRCLEGIRATALVAVGAHAANARGNPRLLVWVTHSRTRANALGRPHVRPRVLSRGRPQANRVGACGRSHERLG